MTKAGYTGAIRRMFGPYGQEAGNLSAMSGHGVENLLLRKQENYSLLQSVTINMFAMLGIVYN